MGVKIIYIYFFYLLEYYIQSVNKIKTISNKDNIEKYIQTQIT